jgi:hypothetical protein
VGSHPAKANFVLQYMDWLVVCVENKTPNVDHCTMWVVYEGVRKTPDAIILRQQLSRKINTCQPVTEDDYEKQLQLTKPRIRVDAGPIT